MKGSSRATYWRYRNLGPRWTWLFSLNWKYNLFIESMRAALPAYKSHITFQIFYLVLLFHCCCCCCFVIFVRFLSFKRKEQQNLVEPIIKLSNYFHIASVFIHFCIIIIFVRRCTLNYVLRKQWRRIVALLAFLFCPTNNFRYLSV